MYIRVHAGAAFPDVLAGIPSRLGQAAATAVASFTPSEMKALRITDAIENTAWYMRNRKLSFGGLAGDFDGQGLSFGLLQWNIGTGSLQPLLRALEREYPHRFNAAFGAEAARLREVLGQSREAQLAWARGINDRTSPKRPVVREPWASHFRRIGEDPAFQAIQLRHVRPRMDAARKYARQFGLKTERGLALMFDIVTQQGPYWLTCQKESCKRRAKLIDGRRTALIRQLGRGPTERELLELIAHVVADVALPQWREKVRTRKLMIVQGRGRVHGHDFDLQRDFGLTDRAWETDDGGPIVPTASHTAPPAIPRTNGAPPAASPVIPERVITLNRRYAASLRWGEQRAAISRLLGFTDRTPDEQELAAALARWQRQQGLTDDGILGPVTWARLSQLLPSAGRAPGAPPPTTAPVGHAPPLGTYERIRFEIARILSHPSEPRDWGAKGSLLTNGQYRLQIEHPGSGALNRFRRYGFQNSNKCNLFGLDLAWRSGFRVPLLNIAGSREPRRYSYPLANHLTTFAVRADRRGEPLRGSNGTLWGSVRSRASAAEINLASAHGALHLLVGWRRTGIGHVGIIDQVVSRSPETGPIRKIVYNGWEATSIAAQRLNQRTWSAVTEPPLTGSCVAKNPGTAMSSYYAIHIIALEPEPVPRARGVLMPIPNRCRLD